MAATLGDRFVVWHPRTQTVQHHPLAEWFEHPETHPLWAPRRKLASELMQWFAHLRVSTVNDPHFQRDLIQDGLSYLHTLGAHNYDTFRSLRRVADLSTVRGWDESERLSRLSASDAIKALRDAEHGTWILQHVPAPEAWAATLPCLQVTARTYRSDGQPVVRRTHLVEAEGLGWFELDHGLVDAEHDERRHNVPSTDWRQWETRWWMREPQLCPAPLRPLYPTHWDWLIVLTQRGLINPDLFQTHQSPASDENQPPSNTWTDWFFSPKPVDFGPVFTQTWSDHVVVGTQPIDVSYSSVVQAQEAVPPSTAT